MSFAVDDHVERQDQDDEEVAHRAEARDGELLYRTRQLDCVDGDVVEEADRLIGQADLVEPEGVEPLLPRLHEPRQIVAERRHAGDEVGDGLGEGPGDQDDDEHDGPDHRGVDEDDRADARQDRDEPGEARDDRAQDECEEPGQEEDEDDVAEGEEDRPDEAHEDEAEGERPEDENGRHPAALPFRHHRHRRAHLARRAGRLSRRGRCPLPSAPW